MPLLKTSQDKDGTQWRRVVAPGLTPVAVWGRDPTPAAPKERDFARSIAPRRYPSGTLAHHHEVMCSGLHICVMFLQALQDS